MNLFDVAFDYAQKKADEDIDRESTSISTKLGNTNLYEVSARLENSGSGLPRKVSFDVDETSDLHREIKSVFDRIQDLLNVQDGRITSIYISKSLDMHDPDYSFYSMGNSDYYTFIGIEKHSIGEYIKDELYQMVIELLSEWDDTVSRKSIVNCEWLFSDRETVNLMTVTGKVKTPYPNRYYDVDSLEEYVDNIDDATLDQDQYEIKYKCSVDPTQSLMSPITTDMKERVEDIMWRFTERSLNTNVNHRIEGEEIRFGEKEELRETKERMKYYVYIPIMVGKN